MQRLTDRPEQDAVLSRLAALRPCRVLDLGCGTGILAARARDALPAATVVGCDFSRGMLDRAVSERQIAPCDTASIAHVLGGLGREFARPEVADVAQASPKATVEAIADIILRGLVAPSADAAPQPGRTPARRGRS